MKRILLFALCILTLASCKKFIDINENPNDPTDVSPRVLMPVTTVGIGWSNGNELGRLASVLVQYNAGLANSALTYDSYNIGGLLDNQWDFEIYNGTVNNLRILIEKSEGTSPAYSGAAKIQLAYLISIATDLWGDVPYSEAGFGLKFLQPRYDKQEDIYKGNSSLGIVSLFDLVRSGLEDLSKPSVLTPGSDDKIYGGDMDAWKKAGGTLLLKFANTISNVDKPLATSVINEVLSSSTGYITDADDDFSVKFTTANGNQNPLYQQDWGNPTFRHNQMLSARLLTLSKSLNDTVRLSKMYTKPLKTRFVAYDNGSNVASPTLANRSEYNNYVVGTIPTGGGEAPIRLLTNFQSNFILAEAAVTLGINSGDANKYYQAGIKGSMSKTGMTTDEINKYFADNPTFVNLSGSDADKVKQIITQKYLAWVGNGIEAYNDYRRTGYPVLALSLSAAGDNPAVIPKRYAYTTKEGNANPNQPKPRPKTDQKVWWGL